MPQDTLKKSAYVAVGIPASLIASLKERMSAASKTIDEFRDRLSDEAEAAFDDWVAEGEALVDSLTEPLRHRGEDLEDRIASRTEIARDVGRGVAVTLTEPIVAIDEIDGIGPAFAEELVKAGVVSTRALVERCRNKESTARLADQTGIGISLLDKWSASADLTRIGGVGDEYMALLNGLGVATIEAMARQDAGDLRQRAVAVNEETELVEVIPSEKTFSIWIERSTHLHEV